MDLENVHILDRDPRYFERGVQEAIYISELTNQLLIIGRYKVPKVYDPILMSRVRKVTVLRSGYSVDEGCSVATENFRDKTSVLRSKV